MEKSIGKVIQIIGPVVDIRFESDALPDLLGAIEIEHEGRKVVCEVASQIGDDVVRCVAMSSTDGMSRGMDAVYTGSGITFAVRFVVLRLSPSAVRLGTRYLSMMDWV